MSSVELVLEYQLDSNYKQQPVYKTVNNSEQNDIELNGSDQFPLVMYYGNHTINLDNDDDASQQKIKLDPIMDR